MSERMKENEEMLQEEETAVSVIKGFEEMQNTSGSKVMIQTTITDSKVLFNLDEKIDKVLNDCENQEINVKDVVIKTYEKTVPEYVDEFTGELKTKERKIITILLDENNKSYVTASKLFAMRMIRAIQLYGVEKIQTEGLLIRITKSTYGDKGNKKLGFEIL